MKKAATDSQTNLSILRRLKQQPVDDQAWVELVSKYGCKLLAWCRGWGLQGADSDDVVQTVLMKVATNVHRFVRKGDGSFRRWLKTIAHNCCHDLTTNRQYGVLKGGELVEQILNSEAARDDLARHLEMAWDQELLEIACERVQLRVKPKTWEAFLLSAVEGCSTEEVADQLQMNLPSVYKAKSNVVKILREEIRDLEESEL